MPNAVGVPGVSPADPRVLFLLRTLVPPPVSEDANAYAFLSQRLRGEVIQPLWLKTASEIKAHYGENGYPTWTMRRFRYNWLPYKSGFLGTLRIFGGYIRTGLRLHREEKLDCIVTYSHMTIALCGVVLKWLTGAKLLVLVVCEPHTNYLMQAPKRSLHDYVMHAYSYVCLHISMYSCDRAMFLAPNLLRPFRWLRNKPHTVLHDYTQRPEIESANETTEEKYILFLGYPWFRKGVDVLIAAFRKIAADFPDTKLKLVGHFGPDNPLHELASGCPQIEIFPGCSMSEALKLMSGCELFCMPSRSEGMGRVFIEAMWCRKPSIGGATGGIPHLVRDGVNGLIVPPGDVDALAAALRKLLENPALRTQMGEAGYEMAQKEFSISRYVDGFREAVELAIGR